MGFGLFSMRDRRNMPRIKLEKTDPERTPSQSPEVVISQDMRLRYNMQIDMSKLSNPSPQVLNDGTG